MKRIFLFFVLISVHAMIHSGQNLLEKVYASLLGNQDVNLVYQEDVVQALKDFHVTNAEEVQVKQMNNVGPLFAGLDLASFTAFGIWLDEEYFDTLSPQEKTFQVYHEAAHYYAKHHQKLLFGGMAVMLLVGLGMKKLHDYLENKKITPTQRYSLVAGTTLLLLVGLYGYLLPKVVKAQEKEADLWAAQLLRSLGKKDAVDFHIEGLKQYSSETQATWWYSSGEQINYLENSLL